MSAKHVLIIGAGIAGLSAASYLLRNGYRVTVLEQHTEPGGLCTSWKRNGYTIDYCVHWLMGTKEGSDSHDMWEELGAFSNEDGSRVPIVNFPEYSTVILSSGERVCLSSDLAILRNELLRIGPEDKREIDSFCKDLKKLGQLFSASSAMHRMVHFLGQLRVLIRHFIPMEQYASRFKSPKLKELFLSEIPPSWSLVALTLGLCQQPFQSAGYPVGGSLNLAKNIARVVVSLGGDIRYGIQVNRILVEDDKAVGVVLADGTSLAGDYVISAADGHQTLFSFLDGKYVPPSYQKAFAQYPLFPSTVYVALGVNHDCSGMNHELSPYFKDPIRFFDGTSHNRFNLNVYHYDPTLAPKGRTLVTVLLNTYESNVWEDLRVQDRAQYEAEKQRIADEVIIRLGPIMGLQREEVEMIDVSTPHSVIRYTGNWKGSFEGFAPTKMTLSRRLPKVLPGLRNFAMIGQWTTPGGGLPSAAKDGRNIAKQLCKEAGMRFTTNLPSQK